MSRLLIEDATVVPVDDHNSVRQHTSILVDDGTIVKVGPADEISSHEGGAEFRLDGRHSVVLPGLVDCHVHLVESIMSGLVPDSVGGGYPLLKNWMWPLQQVIGKEEGKTATELSILQMLKSGTTSFLEGQLHSQWGLDESAEVIRDSGMRGIITKMIMNSPQAYDPNSKAGHPFAEDADSAIKRFEEAHRKWDGKGGGRVGVWLGPTNVRACDAELFKRIAALALEYDSGVTMHLTEVKADVEHLNKLGVTAGRYMHDLGLTGKRRVYSHGIALNAEDFGIFARTGTTVVYCPVSNMKLSQGIAPIVPMMNSGVNVALGCDGGPNSESLDMFGEMRTGALLQKISRGDPTCMTAYDVLKIATINGARALGMEDKVGSLEEGKRADIIMLDLEHPHFYPGLDPVLSIVFSATGRDVRNVIVDGRIVVKDFEIQTLEQGRVLKDARRSADKIVEKSGITR